jgi:general nucleoside transport system ATP-binding protein
LAVIYEGSFMTVTDPETLNEEELGLLMAGERPDGAGADSTFGGEAGAGEIDADSGAEDGGER